jgi:hypothetical protein
MKQTYVIKDLEGMILCRICVKVGLFKTSIKVLGDPAKVVIE